MLPMKQIQRLGCCEKGSPSGSSAQSTNHDDQKHATVSTQNSLLDISGSSEIEKLQSLVAMTHIQQTQIDKLNAAINEIQVKWQNERKRADDLEFMLEEQRILSDLQCSGQEVNESCKTDSINRNDLERVMNELSSCRHIVDGLQRIHNAEDTKITEIEGAISKLKGIFAILPQLSTSKEVSTHNLDEFNATAIDEYEQLEHQFEQAVGLNMRENGGREIEKDCLRDKCTTLENELERLKESHRDELEQYRAEIDKLRKTIIVFEDDKLASMGSEIMDLMAQCHEKEDTIINQKQIISDQTRQIDELKSYRSSYPQSQHLSTNISYKSSSPFDATRSKSRTFQTPIARTFAPTLQSPYTSSFATARLSSSVLGGVNGIGSFSANENSGKSTASPAPTESAFFVK
ncbi:hypothetical protein ACOME3_007538 [Neoechinorhynchus agilis]